MFELLIVIGMIGILLTVGLPSYTSYVQRGRITEAVSMLTEYRVQLEQFFQDNRSYGSSANNCGNNIGSFTGRSFDFACSWGNARSDQEFLVIATGKDSMAGFAFTIDQDNVRTTTAFPGESNLPVNCWILKAGQPC
jgi:type IV pilus assembly protein PilE